MSAAKARRKVVVDGSNLATEGRSVPSLSQLTDAVAAWKADHPGHEVIVVVDASFEHKVAEAERAKVTEAEHRGELIITPAGAIGRGDAFLLQIAERADATVLSNDSFQEFHKAHPWLFEDGRLIGGKAVPGVGWVFTPRVPVRGQKTARVSTKKATATKVPAKKVAVAKKVPPAKKVPTTPAPEALRRNRKPVNSEESYALFRATYRIGARIDGIVKTFTSHGAVVDVTLKDGSVFEMYAATASLGDPAPAKARDVLARGDIKNFKLLSVDAERRIAEVGLP